MKARERNLLSELMASVSDALDTGDLVGHVRAWLDWAEHGERDASERVPACIVPASRVAPAPTPQGRAAVALAMTGLQGTITSGYLAETTGVSQETARLDLQALASRGLLAATGAKRGRVYELTAGGMNGE